MSVLVVGSVALDSVGKLMGVRIVGDTRTYTIKEDDRFVISLGDPGLRRALAERLARREAETNEIDLQLISAGRQIGQMQLCIAKRGYVLGRTRDL